MAKTRKKKLFQNCVVAYLRYSTHNQDELSIEYQRERITKYCSDKGYTIVKFFIDEAHSATTDNRPEFQKMIGEAHNEPCWSRIIVFNCSRFFRNMDMDGFYRYVLQKLGIVIESTIEDNSNNPEAELLRHVTSSFNAYFPKSCAVHTHASLKTKAGKCQHCGGKPPLGYDIKDEKLIINKYEAETVKLIFELYDKNYSYNEMMKVLEEQGRTTKNGTPFKKSSFNAILKQEKYKGTFVWNKAAPKKNRPHSYGSCKPTEEQVRIEGGCKAIIDKELFERVQDKMKNNRKRTFRSSGNHHYMLGGMGKIYCSECGSPMAGASYKSHGKSYRYYVCPNHKKNGCSIKNIRADYIEKFICINIVKNIINKKNYLNYNDILKNTTCDTSNASLRKELAGTEKAIANILKLLENHPSDEANERFDSLVTKKREIQNKISAQSQIPQITTDNYKELRSKIAKELKISLSPVVYDILDKTIDRVTVSNDNINIELNI